jgi:hypothetical protein
MSPGSAHKMSLDHRTDVTTLSTSFALLQASPAAIGNGRTAHGAAETAQQNDGANPAFGEGEKVCEARDATRVRFPGGACFIVNSFALLLQQLEAVLAFGALPCQLPLNLGRPLADLLQSANAHAMRQVLGAGAMATAGLRSISARQMAICSQGLLLLEVLMPRLRHRALQNTPTASVASLASTLDSVSEVWGMLKTFLALHCLVHPLRIHPTI